MTRAISDMHGAPLQPGDLVFVADEYSLGVVVGPDDSTYGILVTLHSDGVTVICAMQQVAKVTDAS